MIIFNVTVDLELAGSPRDRLIEADTVGQADDGSLWFTRNDTSVPTAIFAAGAWQVVTIENRLDEPLTSDSDVPVYRRYMPRPVSAADGTP